MKKIEESQFGYLPVFREGCENQQYNLGIRLNATLEEAKAFAKDLLELQSQHANLVNFVNMEPSNYISGGEEYFSKDVWDKMMGRRKICLEVLKEHGII